MTVSARVKVHEVRNGGHHSGIVARFTPDGSFYELWLNRALEELRLSSRTSSAEIRLAFESIRSEWFDDWITLRLEVVGTRLRAFANGQLFFDVTDDDQAAGSAGLTNAGSVTKFDDFVLEASP